MPNLKYDKLIWFAISKTHSPNDKILAEVFATLKAPSLRVTVFDSLKAPSLCGGGFGGVLIPIIASETSVAIYNSKKKIWIATQMLTHLFAMTGINPY
ncbi:hypothetical protein [Helicobacter macacae]|uniref:hypothetical protein n=1 Tax=Helicobacter macacae TaxID=398626 RepID=UPI0004211EEB|nr:hypothetical protein [Helicobacter macacae]